MIKLVKNLTLLNIYMIGDFLFGVKIIRNDWQNTFYIDSPTSDYILIDKYLNLYIRQSQEPKTTRSVNVSFSFL